MALLAGTQLGPYEIQGLLGAGGMGEVYRGRDPRLSREVAVKLITADGASSPERLSRFETEARAAAQLAHPNVVTVFDVGNHEGKPYLVLELLDGQTLRETIRAGTPPMRQSLTWALEAARGLGAAHERGIIHRDLKPENIFLTSDGRVKVLDFGLAKLQEPLVGSSSDTSSPTATKDTSPGVIMGTIGYMAPEQVKGEPAGARSDIFALGAVLYELVSGQRAFSGATSAEILASILRDEPTSLMNLRADTPVSVETVVRRCLGKHPSERFSTGNEVAAALETVLSSFEPSRATGTRVPEPRGPYPGLSSFTEADAERFFGRESEIESLWDKLRQRRLLALIGPSGAGKTSFVRAGLIPSRPTGWGTIAASPGAAPMKGLAQALVGALPSDPDTMRELLAFDDPEVAFRVLKKWRKSHLECLLVLDQFEELFTLNPPEAQAEFTNLLGRLVAEGDVRVLLSMRDDFLIRCYDHETLTPVFQNLTPLVSLGGEDLRRALVEPAKKEGFSFENEGLVDEMLESVEGARGALPLLAFAVARLWEKRDREKKLLTRKAYEQIGGVAGALAQHAEQTLERIGLDREPIVRELFRNLVTAQWTRAVADREQLLSVVLDRDSANQVLDELISARLLTSYEVRDPDRPVSDSHPERDVLEDRAKNLADVPSGTASAQTTHRIEIVHESLLRAWPRLVRWQAQDEEGAVLRDQLKQAAHLWEEKERSPDLLWSGEAYQEFEVWRRRYPGELTALEDEYATAMVQRSRRRKRMRRAALAAVFLGLAAVATVVSISRHEAVQNARRAEAGKLLALGRAEIDRYPTAALAYARGSLELSDTPEARRFVLEALWRAPAARILSPRRVGGAATEPEDPGWGRPVLSLDAKWLAIENRNLQRVLLVPHDGGVARILPRPPGNVHALAFGPRGHVLVSGGEGAALQPWSLPDLRELRPVEVGGVSSWGFFGGESFYALTRVSEGDGHRLLRSWSLPGGEARTLGRVDWDGIAAVSPDPTGHAIAYASGEAVYLLPLDDPRRGASRLLGRHADAVSQVEFLPGGDWVASADEIGEIRLWPLGPDASGSSRALRAPKITAGLFAGDDGARHLARVGVAGTVHVWDLRDPPDAEPAALMRPEVNYAIRGGFDPSGRWLVSANSFNVAFWPMTGHWRRVLPGAYPDTWRMAFTPDGRWLASCTIGEEVRLWPMGPLSGQPPGLAPESCWGLGMHPAGTHALVTTIGGGRVFLSPLAGGPSVPLRTGWEGRAQSFAVAFDARGRRAIACPSGNPELRVLRVWDLETMKGQTFSLTPLTEASHWCEALAFTGDGEILVGGDEGLLRVFLPDSPGGAVSVETLHAAGRALFSLSPDRRRLLVWTGRTPGVGVFDELLLFDLATHTSRRITTHGQRLWTAAFDPSGRTIVSGDIDGAVRVGPVSGEEPHLLLGHGTVVKAVAVSPDGRWIASVSDDGLSLWPMPDVEEPPLHTWPHAELMAKLDDLTNLRVVSDSSSSTRWALDVGPFPGWKDVPEW